MSASGFAGALRELADFADIRGNSVEASSWRHLAQEAEARGYEHAAELGRALTQERLNDRLPLDSTLRIALDQLFVDGVKNVVLRASQALPWLLRQLLERQVVDAAGAALLARHGIVTLQDLEAASADGRLATHLDGYEPPLGAEIGALAQDQPAVPLGRAVDLTESFAAMIEAACREAGPVTAAGGTRRFEPLVGTLVVVAKAPDPPAALERIAAMPQVQVVAHRTARRALVVHQRTEFDVRVAAPDEHGTTLFVATGAPAHLAAMRKREPVPRLRAREEEVYAHAGLPWIAPELRHGTGEVEAAAAGALPALLERRHIRGDLHMHTTYSDGRDSLVDMVQTCASIGYEYIAITDHSARSAAMRTVTADQLLRQRDEIDRLRERWPAMTILHGIEVDIMPDGSLDFPDRVLEPLDIVLASLHDRAGHEPAQLTRRCLGAIAHPLVNVITHPANRLVGQHAGHALDFEAVYAAAAASGTALEIDGAPSHLDLDGEHARAAVAAGVTVTVDSDCHRARLLEKQMQFGVGTARRGWVQPAQVLNTRPLTAVREFVAAKRRFRA